MMVSSPALVLRSIPGMDTRALKSELERLRALAQGPFADKAAGLRWANQVLPLLKFDPEYYNSFNQALHYLHADLMTRNIQMYWSVMLSQVDRAIHELSYRDRGLIATVEPVKLVTPGGTYVAPSRLEELAGIQSPAFDLTKLLALLRELDAAHQQGCYFAIAALVRTILNHVPPIFGCQTFAEVANNYGGGGKSFKESMMRLDQSARKIADLHLHATIRHGEALPTLVQVDFSNELDLLLGEIVRVLKP